MTHPNEYRAHYNPQGLICHCPWGYGKHNQERYGSVKEASKLQWLEGRPGMETPRNQFFLEHVKRPDQGGPALVYGDDRAKIADADKVLPWLHREFNKGRLLPSTYIGHPHFKFKKNGEPWDFGDPDSMQPGEVAYSPEQVERHRKGEGLVPEQPNGKPWAYIGDHTNSIDNLDGFRAKEIEEAVEDLGKRGQGIDLMQHKVHELMPKIKDWRDAKEAKQRDHLGEVLHRFDDGWTVRRLQNQDEHDREGEEMGHCIAGYGDNTEKGTHIYASLRDHKNMPHASIELEPDHWENPETGEISPERKGELNTDPNADYPATYWIPRVGPRSRTLQFYGKEDRSPEPEYENRMNQWLQDKEAPYAYAHNGVIQVPGATTAREYMNTEGEDGDWSQRIPEEDQGFNEGEDPEYNFEDHDWYGIARDYLNSKLHLSPEHEDQQGFPFGQFQMENPNAEPGTRQRWWTDLDLQNQLNTPEEREEFFKALEHRNEHYEFERAMEELGDYNDPREAQLMQEYHDYQNIGAYEEPRANWKEYPLFQDTPNAKPAGEPGYYWNEENKFVPNPPAQGPERYPWQYQTIYRDEAGDPIYSTTRARPLYFRWVYSPQKGVTVNTNQEAHPALVKYHGDLGNDINDTDLSHGYASAIDGGWRITDLEHRPVEDPYIVNQVVRRLNLEDAPQIRSEGSWQPSEYDYERLHYGLPAEISAKN